MEDQDEEKARQKELDAILDAALDELDDDDEDNDDEISIDRSVLDNATSIKHKDRRNEFNTETNGEEHGQNDRSIEYLESNEMNSKKKERPVFGPVVPPSMRKISSSSSSQPSSLPSVSQEEKAIKDMMQHMEALLSMNGDFTAPKHETSADADINDRTNNLAENNDTGNLKNDASISNRNTKPLNQKDRKSKSTTNNSNENMEETMSKIFEKLSQNINHDDISDEDLGDFDAIGGDFMKQMAKEWEATIGGGGGTGDGLHNNANDLGTEEQEEVVGQVVDGMMKQLLSKDFMYEPMKDICNQFPTWLAENKSKIDDKEYERYGKQYQYFQRIVHVYDHDPDNVSRLTELMHDVQEYGQPPKELIKALAPDLDFDESGIPKMDAETFGPMMNEECCIM